LRAATGRPYIFAATVKPPVLSVQAVIFYANFRQASANACKVAQESMVQSWLKAWMLRT